MSLGINFSQELSLWKYGIWFLYLKKKKTQFVGKFVEFLFPLKILPVPSSKLLILALVFSSPVLGLLADSSDKMPNDQGK